jgi:HEAT repeat protein
MMILTPVAFGKPERATREPTRSVDQLVKDLGDKDSDIRADAAEALGKKGKEARGAVSALTQALKDADEDVRELAAEALGLIGEDSKAAVPALTDLLKDDKALVRRAAAEALGKIGAGAGPALSSLLDLLKDADKDVKRAAAEAVLELSPLLTKEAAPILSEALKDRDEIVRELIVEAMGELGPAKGRDAESALIQALKDENVHVRALAAEALQLTKATSEAAGNALVDAINDNEKNPTVLYAAAAALGESGAVPRRAVQALLKLLKAKKTEQHGHVGAAAAEALTHFKLEGSETKEVVAALKAAGKAKSKELKKAAHDALAKIEK